MAGSLNILFSNVGFSLNQHTSALINLQEQTATGNRINRISDEPSTAYRVMGLESEERTMQNYLNSIQEVMSSLELSSSVIEEMVKLLADTKANLTQTASGTSSQQARNISAQLVDDTLKQMLTLANTQYQDSYLFGGANTDTIPFASTTQQGKITAVDYRGSLENKSVEIAKGVQASAFRVGQDVFMGDQRQIPRFLGSTGATAGNGTSSVTGFVWLTVTHDTDTNEYVLSIDDGVTTFRIPDDGSGPANLAVTNADGKILYINTTGINAAGQELVSVEGTHDVFNALITVRDILLNTRGLSDQDIGRYIDQAMETIDESRNTILETSVSVGSRVGFLEKLRHNIDNIKFSTEEERSKLQQADIAAIAIELSRHQVLYEMSLAVIAKMMSLSLLNYI